MTKHLVRRDLLAASAASLLSAVGCAGGRPAAHPEGMSEANRQLLSGGSGPLPVVQRGAEVLRRRSSPVAPADQAQLEALERRMRSTLEIRGVGLAAPQVDVGVRAILVMLDARGDAPHVELFINPRIVERSDDVELDYEGCLSIPDVCGLVRRNRSVVIEHAAPGQSPQRLPVQGFDARIFQHEIDHLDGVLYVDRVEGGLQPMSELKQLREELRARRSQSMLPPPGEPRYVLL